MFTKWWTGNSSPNWGKPVTALLISTTLILSSGCSLLPKEQEEEALPSINPPKLSKKPEYTVKTETLETKVRGSGRLMALQEEKLFFSEDMTSKRISAILVKNGDAVEKGQPVAELDVSDMESDLKRKRLETRKDELTMIETLRKADEMTPEQIEQAKIDFELKREELTKLENQVSKAKLLAPFSGTIVTVTAKKGDTVKSEESVATLADLNELTVAASISADDAKKVSIGMEVQVDINSAGQHKGKVKQLPNPQAAGNNNGGFPGGGQDGKQDSIDQYLVVQLDEFPKGLNRGTPLSVTIITQRKENATTIPLAALRSYSGRNYVQVVDNQGNKKEVDVEIGQQTSTDVEIVKGLTAGQKVVGR
ncbi:efflux RND transporter periplasmic adaptor subunit [Paenibacillus chondroitinus]|uniref:Efflux RND transporter periplasmic adaptor subunit n=1 Tax=Paenibacillus chondroitinus TaxID=59842 RepID=A0ABU6D4K6_9BACL|nr:MULTISPECIES: efflux RND transporter periplasmic adaptor subunit [Paenibacillus]MCY9658327.1 efflux RND transporter periplasmic adaptor subunit [Paenibacillus anseongense]MEB4792674.1 efflux RND transporter periplasmic adaptor subunit [Paenibacillus chondroitinus]